MSKYTIAGVLVGLGVSNPIWADEDFPCCDPLVVVGEPLDPCCVNPMYPYPGTIAPCNSWDIYAQGEFLYFSSSLDSYVNVASSISFDLSELDYLFQKSPYHPGFRVGIGIDLGSAVLDFTYLRYHPHTTSHFSAKEGGGVVVNYNAGIILTEVFGQPRLYFQDVTSSLHLSVDYGLISLQKPVYMGSRLIMNLSYGLLGLWTEQKYKFTSTALNPPPPAFAGVTSSGVSRADHRTWAVGPNLGFQGIGILPWHFKALIAIDLSLMYGSCYKVLSTGFFPQALFPMANSTVKEKEHSAHLEAFHNSEIGIGWGDYFFCDRYYLDLYVTYNFVFQHIFNYSTALTPVGFDGMNLSNYSMHGFAIGGRIDF